MAVGPLGKGAALSGTGLLPSLCWRPLISACLHPSPISLK